MAHIRRGVVVAIPVFPARLLALRPISPGVFELFLKKIPRRGFQPPAAPIRRFGGFLFGGFGGRFGSLLSLGLPVDFRLLGPSLGPRIERGQGQRRQDRREGGRQPQMETEGAHSKRRILCILPRRIELTATNVLNFL